MRGPSRECRGPGLMGSVLVVQGALLLSEVLRERDAQLEHKKRRQEATKMVDQRYIRLQEEVRS